jgi:hypothetical protein
MPEFVRNRARTMDAECVRARKGFPEAGNFGANWMNDAIAGDLADPDNDGFNNFLERALNGNPNVAIPLLVQLTTVGGKLAVTFTRAIANTDLTMSVFAADSLAGNWSELARSAAGATTVVIEPGATANETGTGNTRTVEVRDLYLKRFRRDSTGGQGEKRTLLRAAQVAWARG